MLVVADEEEGDSGEAVGEEGEDGAFDEGVPRPKDTQLELAESISSYLREHTAALHEEMQTHLDASAEEDVVQVPRGVLSAWAAEVFEVNKGVGAQSRVAAQRLDRLTVELSIMGNAMASDLLDREATHTHTIEEIVRVTSHAEVAKAMRVVSQLHGGTSHLTTDVPLSYFGAATCAAAAPDPVEEGA